MSFFLTVNAAEAITVSPSATSVEVGDTFSVTINLEATDSIGGIQFLMSNDSSKAQLTGASPGSVFAGLSHGIDFFAFPASISASSYGQTFLFAADKSGPASLMVFTYKALAAGVAGFSFQSQFSNSQSQDPIPFSSTAAVTVTTPDTTPAVPLPASGWLMIAAFAGLAGQRARRRNP